MNTSFVNKKLIVVFRALFVLTALVTAALNRFKKK